MATPQRYIAHFDLDSFFVSVEVLNNPSLKNKPVIVGGSAERGVVSTCSYEARKYGIHSAMPMRKAMQLCPHAIIVKSTRGEYSRYSRWVTDIIAAKAPLFEKASVDEFYIDLTGMDKYFDVFQWTKDLRSEIINATKLPISFGLATNKMIAKIATDESKPNGYIFVQPGMEAAFLAPLPISKIPGVGKATLEKLNQFGIANIGDVQKYSLPVLQKYLGNYGEELLLKSKGIHTREVSNYHEAKSISTEHTFEENISELATLKTNLVKMAEKVAYELRKDKKLCGCVAVKLRYPNFETITKQTTIDYTFSDADIIQCSQLLLTQMMPRPTPIRLLGIRLTDLTNHAQQTNLFIDTEKQTNLHAAIDSVKQRFGTGMLTKASSKGNISEQATSKGKKSK